MNDLSGNALEILKGSPYDLIMNWRTSQLKCAKCGISTRVKYIKNNKTYCQHCVDKD